MLNLNQRPNGGSEGRTAEPGKQPRRLLLALLLLVVAFAAVVVRDHEFWFGSDQSSDADATEQEIPEQTAQKSAPAVTSPAPVAPATTSAAAPKKQLPVAKNSATPKLEVKTAQKPAVKTEVKTEAKPAEAPAVAANRTAVAPLDVEVVAGDTHKTLRPGSNSLKVEILKPAAPSHSTFAGATNAAEREHVAENVSSPNMAVTTVYPALAQQMRVQGSVVLQAFIGADGTIENLRVLSGPAILANAAQQAVREWHFKPYLQNGQPVETKATITVNFTIRVGDSAPKVS
ncbi:MAG: TonB family protein [Candidatus Sulfotelmatobacter sp.]